MQRDVYLETTPLEEAIEKWFSRLSIKGLIRTFDGEPIDIRDSFKRVTAEAIIAKMSSPFFHSSAMDGYAVRFKDTIGASEKNPIRLKIGEGAVYVDTGDPLPDGYNAVIMIEDVNIVKESGDEYIEIIQPVTPWQHVRVIGEDIVATELIMPENHLIRAIDIGAVLSGGHTIIKVRRKPEVLIIPTGTEIVEPGSNLKKGDIIEFNSRIFENLLYDWGAKPIRHSIVPDEPAELKKVILDYVDEVDLIVINAGSSAGSEDFTPQVVKELGEVIVHGVAIKPGGPVLLGIIKNKPVAGIPGYPVSAYITFTLFIKPLIFKWLGLEIEKPEVLRAKISRQVASVLGKEEFLRVKVGKVGNNFIATPISRGAGVLMSLVRADGFVRIPAMSEGIGAGAEVDVELLRTKEEIENTIVCIGSHDNTLDLLANFLKIRKPGYSLSSAHVGSMGGLLAIKRGEAHIAGTHLLDEETGDYNIPFIKRLLPDVSLFLINLVYREQGLLVLKGNPKNIKGFEDLKREDVTFVNRQGGSGTRLLTDKCLRELGIQKHEIKGYEREEYTHMGIASAVLTGVADTGLAILSAANALRLDFIPVAKERYDLIIPKAYYDTEMIQELLDIIRNDINFKEAVLALGGYDVSDMGKIIFES